MRPPLSPTTAPSLLALRADHSSVRQAPWEKPRRTIRFAGTHISIDSTSFDTMPRAALRWGSLLSSGDVNGWGYQVLSAA
jgi:hypothetical protein